MLDFVSHSSSSQGNFYTLIEGSHILGIECGISKIDIQKALNFQASLMDGCLISHMHGDHSKSWADLSLLGVDLYASKETWQYLTSVKKIKYAAHRLHELSSNVPKVIGKWSVTPFDTVHDCEGSLGFVIDSISRNRVLFLSDSCYSKYRFEGLTRICIECNHSMEILKANALAADIDMSRFKRTANNHMSLERLIDMLKANDLTKVERITLLHLSDANSDEVAFKNAIERATGIPTEIAAKGR